jgi:hypothetical protein
MNSPLHQVLEAVELAARIEQYEMDRFNLQYGDLLMCEGGEPGRCVVGARPCTIRRERSCAENPR